MRSLFCDNLSTISSVLNNQYQLKAKTPTMLTESIPESIPEEEEQQEEFQDNAETIDTVEIDFARPTPVPTSTTLDDGASEDDAPLSSLEHSVESALIQWRETLSQLPGLRDSDRHRLSGPRNEMILDNATLKAFSRHAIAIAQGGSLQPWAWESKFGEEVRQVITTSVERASVHDDENRPVLTRKASRHLLESNDDLQQANEDLQKQLNNLQFALDVRTNDNAHLQAEMSRMQTEREELIADQRRLEKENEDLIACYAQLLALNEQHIKEKRVLRNGWRRECKNAARLKTQPSVELERERRKYEQLRESLQLSEEEANLLIRNE